MDPYWSGVLSGATVTIAAWLISYLKRKFFNPVVWHARRDTSGYWAFKRMPRDPAFEVDLLPRIDDWKPDPEMGSTSADVAKHGTVEFWKVKPPGTFVLTWIDAKGRSYALAEIFESTTELSIRQSDVVFGQPDGNLVVQR